MKRINFQISQVGIVSLGAGCGDYRFPALYTRVTKVHRYRYNICSNFNMKDKKNIYIGTNLLKLNPLLADF